MFQVYVSRISAKPNNNQLSKFLSKIKKRVVPNKDHVVGKIVSERIGVWTRQLGTPEYLFDKVTLKHF